MLQNLAWRSRLAMGRIGTDMGSAHSERSVDQSIDYIEEVYGDYKRYGGVDCFRGRVAEIGPGDSAGVALLMRRYGCDRVDLIDRFLSRYDPTQQATIYESLSGRHQLESLRIGTCWNGRALSGVTWRNGESSEQYFKNCAREEPGSYDFIVSRAVLEHLEDPLECLRDMISCLRPGGRALHKIDLRDHGMFSIWHDELTWLEIPGFLWSWMTSCSGHPNRILSHRYRDVLEPMRCAGSIDYSMLITSLAGVGEIAPHRLFRDVGAVAWGRALALVERRRHAFAPEFRDVPSEDLATTGIFLVAEKH